MWWQTARFRSFWWLSNAPAPAPRPLPLFGVDGRAGHLCNGYWKSCCHERKSLSVALNERFQFLGANGQECDCGITGSFCVSFLGGTSTLFSTVAAPWCNPTDMEERSSLSPPSPAHVVSSVSDFSCSDRCEVTYTTLAVTLLH